MTKGQTIIYSPLHRKQMIEQHMWNSLYYSCKSKATETVSKISTQP